MRLGRAILLLVLVLAAAWVAMQVVSIYSDDDAVELRVDKQKLRDVGHEAVEKTEELLHKAGEKLQSSHNQSTPPAPPDSDSNAIQPGETIHAPEGTPTP